MIGNLSHFKPSSIGQLTIQKCISLHNFLNLDGKDAEIFGGSENYYYFCAQFFTQISDEKNTYGPAAFLQHHDSCHGPDGQSREVGHHDQAGRQHPYHHLFRQD